MHRSFMSGLMVAAGLAALLTSMPAAAQFAKPEDAIKYRKAGMTIMATHFGRVAAMANGRVPFDAKAAADNAELATIVSKLPFAGFVEGSDKGRTPRPSRRSGPRTTSSGPPLRRCRTRWPSSMPRPRPATSTRSRRPSAPTGQACKACHDNYRKE